MKNFRLSICSLGLLVSTSCAEKFSTNQPSEKTDASQKKESAYDMQGHLIENNFDADRGNAEANCKASSDAQLEFYDICKKKGYRLVRVDVCSSACSGDVMNPILSAASSIPKSMVGKTVYNEQWEGFKYVFVERQASCLRLTSKEDLNLLKDSGEEAFHQYEEFVSKCTNAGFYLLISGPCSVACTGHP